MATVWMTIQDARKKWGMSYSGVFKAALKRDVPIKRQPKTIGGPDVAWIDVDAFQRVYVDEVNVPESEIGGKWLLNHQAEAVIGVRSSTIDTLIAEGRLRYRRVILGPRKLVRRIVLREDAERIRDERDRMKAERRELAKLPKIKLPKPERQLLPKIDRMAIWLRVAKESERRHDEESERELPQDLIARRALAVRLLTTPTLIDLSPNPYYVGHLTERLVDEMEARILSGEVTITADRLPIRRRVEDGNRASQHYVYSPIGQDRTFVRIASR
jgi:hypothetical protein